MHGHSLSVPHTHLSQFNKTALPLHQHKGQKASFQARRRLSVTKTHGTGSTMISDFTRYTHSRNTNSPCVTKGRILHLQKQTRGQLLPPKGTEALI